MENSLDKLIDFVNSRDDVSPERATAAYKKVMRDYAEVLAAIPTLNLVAFVAKLSSEPRGSADLDGEAIKKMINETGAGGLIRICVMATLITEIEVRLGKDRHNITG